MKPNRHFSFRIASLLALCSLALLASCKPANRPVHVKHIIEVDSYMTEGEFAASLHQNPPRQ